jgi:alpha-mannosidase
MWENFSRDHTLRLKFRFDDKVYRTVAEDNFGTIERTFNPDYNLSEHIPAGEGREARVNTAPMQRFVWANGLGIITEGLPEYGVEGNDLFITLLRSVGKLSGGAIETRGTPAGPPLDVPGAQCLGVQRVRYAIYATDKPEELFMEADQFMRPVLTEAGVARDNSGEKEIPHSLLNFDNPHIYTYAVKLPYNQEQNGMIVRLMNTSDREQRINIQSELKFSRITEVNSLESPVSKPMDTAQEIIFKPYELKSLLME